MRKTFLLLFCLLLVVPWNALADPGPVITRGGTNREISKTLTDGVTSITDTNVDVYYLNSTAGLTVFMADGAAMYADHPGPVTYHQSGNGPVWIVVYDTAESIWDPSGGTTVYCISSPGGSSITIQHISAVSAAVTSHNGTWTVE